MKIQLPSDVAVIYQAVKRLETLYPGRKFTPDGHLVGSIGEVIAKQAFDLELLPASSKSHDAIDRLGRLVQIKLTGGDSVSMYDNCERLIVMKIISDNEAEVVYDGPGYPVWNAAGKAGKNGQRPISLSKLRKLSATS